MRDPGKLRFLNFARGGRGVRDPGKSHLMLACVTLANRIFGTLPGVILLLRGGLAMVDPGKLRFLGFARDGWGVVDPGKLRFLGFARGGWDVRDPGKGSFLPFARGG